MTMPDPQRQCSTECVAPCSDVDCVNFGGYPEPSRRKGGQLPLRTDVAGELIERTIEWHRANGPERMKSASNLHRAVERYLEVIGYG